MVKKMIDINEYIIHTNKSNIGNRQAVFKFPNGYGASLIQGPSSYGGEDGLFEIAVLEFNTGNGWELFDYYILLHLHFDSDCQRRCPLSCQQYHDLDLSLVC